MPVGFYPSPPGRRMALDLDGSTFFYASATAAYPLDTAAMRTVNDEAATVSPNIISYISTGDYMGIFFPEFRDIVAYWIAWGGGLLSISTSADTTNGIDGTWNNRIPSPGMPTNYWSVESLGWNKVLHRIYPYVVNWTGVRAIRFQNSAGGNRSITDLHLYGGPSTGQNPDRLRSWHPTLDQELPGDWFDWGNVARTQISEKSFRIKNNSTTLDANNIVVSMDALTDSTPTFVSQHQFSLDGTTFSSTVTVPFIAKNTISTEVVTVRQSIAANASLVIWDQRIRSEATSWS